MTQIDTDTKTLIEGITSLGTVVVIKTDEDLKEGVTYLSSIKANAKTLKTKKDAALNPLKESIKEINSWFKPAEDHLKSMEEDIKDIMLTYADAKEAAARKQIASIERRVDKGTLSIDKATAKLTAVDQLDSSIQTANGGVQFRQGPAKVKITDAKALIAAYPELLKTERVLEALRMEVSDCVIKKGLSVPGVEVYRDRIVAGMTV